MQIVYFGAPKPLRPGTYVPPCPPPPPPPPLATPLVDSTPQTDGGTQGTSDDGHDSKDELLLQGHMNVTSDGSKVGYRSRSGRAVREPKRYNDYVKI